MINSHIFAILAHKDSPHLRQCIDSLRNQNVRSKIIICTSTPSDFLKTIARDNGIELFINPEKNGIVADWNFALEKADAQYATLAHQDDVYHPGYSEEVLNNAKSGADALVIFTDYDELLMEGREVTVRKKSLNFFIKHTLLRLNFKNRNYNRENKKNLLRLGNPIGCPTVTFNKETIGNFKFDPSFSVNLDWKGWYDLAEKSGGFIWIRKTLVSHRIYPGSETSLGLAENRRQKEDLEIFKLFWPEKIALLLSKIYNLSYKNNSFKN